MIIFASRTGNVKKIVSSIDSSIKKINIDEISYVDEPFLIFTYTDKIGEVPEKVSNFMAINFAMCRGVIASGNTNFGSFFCNSADVLSNQYSIPIVRKIDLRGTKEDIAYIEDFYFQNFQKGDVN